jgi:hypothetical protein
MDTLGLLSVEADQIPQSAHENYFKHKAFFPASVVAWRADGRAPWLEARRGRTPHHKDLEDLALRRRETPPRGIKLSEVT